MGRIHTVFMHQPFLSTILVLVIFYTNKIYNVIKTQLKQPIRMEGQSSEVV